MVLGRDAFSFVLFGLMMTNNKSRLAILASHPIQYHAPLFRALADLVEIKVFFAHLASKGDQSQAGFGVEFDWDVDLLSGFNHEFLNNLSAKPSTSRFFGCNTPDIAEKLDRWQPDVLLVMGWNLKTYWQGVWAAKSRGIPVMVRGDSHMKTPRNRFKRFVKSLVYPILLRTFDVALYVGEYSRQYWEYYSYPEARMIFAPHCVDNEWFAARATPTARRDFRSQNRIGYNETVLLYVGKLLPLKRVVDIVNAAAVCKQRGHDVSVAIVGAGITIGNVKAVASATGVRLIELGFCNQSELPAIYAGSDVLVLASDSETWGLVANEALACGTPIIVSESCGCGPDLAADDRTGCIYPTGDIELLAEAIERRIVTHSSVAYIQQKASEYSATAAAKGIVAGLILLSRSSNQ